MARRWTHHDFRDHLQKPLRKAIAGLYRFCVSLPWSWCTIYVFVLLSSIDRHDKQICTNLSRVPLAYRLSCTIYDIVDQAWGWERVHHVVKLLKCWRVILPFFFPRMQSLILLRNVVVVCIIKVHASCHDIPSKVLIYIQDGSWKYIIILNLDDKINLSLHPGTAIDATSINHQSALCVV